MSPTFLAFLLIMAAFLLLSGGRGSEQSARNSSAADALLLLVIATAWYSVACGWTGQLVGYTIYADMGVIPR